MAASIPDHQLNPLEVSKSSAHHTASAGRLGFWLSMACAVHCIAMPILFLVTPALSARIKGLEWLEWAAAGFAFALTIIQLWPEYVAHRRPGALVLATLGITLLICGLIIEHMVEAVPFHTIAMVGGSLLMATAFYRGHRLRHHT